MKPRLKTLKSTLQTLPSRLQTLGGTGRRSGSAELRWTGRKLQTWRSRILQRDGFICQLCKAEGRVTPAQEVDHVVPLEEGGTYADSNGMAVCVPCHRAKTARDRGYKQRPQIGMDGWPVDPKG